MAPNFDHHQLLRETFLKSEEWFRLLVESAPVGIVISDPDQNTVYINNKFTELFGYTIEDMPSVEEWWVLAYPDEKLRTRVRRLWNRAVKKAVSERSEIKPVEYPVYCKDGTVRDIEFRLASIGEMNIVLFTDVTDRRKAEREIKESEEKFRALAENSPIAIMIYQDDYFVYTNEAGVQISGYSREELYKMSFWELIHPDYRDLVRSRGRMRQAGKPAPPRYEFKIVTKSGEEKWVNLTGSTTLHGSRPAGFVSVIDITEQKNAVEALKLQLRFEKLVAAVSAALVSVPSEQLDDSINRVLKLCGEFLNADRSYLLRFADDGVHLEHISEWCAEGIEPQAENLKHLNINDRPWWSKKLLEEGFIYIPDVEKMPAEACAEKEEFLKQKVKSCVEFAVKREGKLRRVLGFDSLREKKVWTEQQIALLRVAAEIISNAVSRLRAEQALKQSEERHRQILSTMEEGYYEVDLVGNFTFFNESFCKIIGYDSEQLMGKSYKILYRDPNVVFEPYNRVYRTGITEKAANLPIITGDGRKIFTEVSITLRRDGDGNPVGFRGVVRDITERKLHEDKLKYLSLHDQLTGLYNRAYFENELNRLNKSREYPVTIIVCDLDGLKLINDTLGHESGDRLLVACAGLLKSVLRSEDVLARVGGDEFVLILPHTDRQSGISVVSRIETAIAGYNQESSRLPVSISLGLATAEDVAIPLQEAYKEADDLMYRDKLHKGTGAKSQIIRSLMAALGERDFITEGHARRLEILCRKTGEKLGLSQKQLSDLALLAQVHDLGKVGIPDSILFKKGPLNKNEWKIMRTHPEKGHRIASASTDLYGIAELILKHHEHWDGKGYPAGLAGEKIPIECRILAIADAFDAMTSDRPYRKAMSLDQAVLELKNASGKQFDPHLVEVFLEIIEEQEVED